MGAPTLQAAAPLSDISVPLANRITTHSPRVVNEGGVHVVRPSANAVPIVPEQYQHSTLPALQQSVVSCAAPLELTPSVASACLTRPPLVSAARVSSPRVVVGAIAAGTAMPSTLADRKQNPKNLHPTSNGHVGDEGTLQARGARQEFLRPQE